MTARPRRPRRTSASRRHVPQIQPVALDDPVPADSGIAVVEPHFCQNPPHYVEREVRRALLAEEDLKFTSLVIRRVADGVCLEGILEVDDTQDAPDVDALARQVAGVERVINHLFVHSCCHRDFDPE